MELLLVKNDSNSEILSDTKIRMFDTDLPFFMMYVFSFTCPSTQTDINDLGCLYSFIEV